MVIKTIMNIIVDKQPWNYGWWNYHEYYRIKTIMKLGNGKCQLGNGKWELGNGKTVMNIQIYHEIVYNVRNILCKYLFWQQASYEIFILTITHENKI